MPAIPLQSGNRSSNKSQSKKGGNDLILDLLNFHTRGEKKISQKASTNFSQKESDDFNYFDKSGFASFNDNNNNNTTNTASSNKCDNNNQARGCGRGQMMNNALMSAFNFDSNQISSNFQEFNFDFDF
mmetsp:Transcript_3148/g.2715  ORF Transcript_3148/g.2715 Transcript_3148/m.2715 type:complete len:128 (-) Transcript_3148:777-1160(-)